MLRLAQGLPERDFFGTGGCLRRCASCRVGPNSEVRTLSFHQVRPEGLGKLQRVEPSDGQTKIT